MKKQRAFTAGILAGVLLLAMAGCSGKNPAEGADVPLESEASASVTDDRETGDTTSTTTQAVTTTPETTQPESTEPEQTKLTTAPAPVEPEEPETPSVPPVTTPEEIEPEPPAVDYRALYMQAMDNTMSQDSGWQETSLEVVIKVQGQELNYKQFNRLACTDFTVEDELLMTGFEELDGTRLQALLYYQDYMVYAAYEDLKVRAPISSDEELFALLNGDGTEDTVMDFQESYYEAITLMREEDGRQILEMTYKNDMAERLAAEVLEQLGITEEAYQAPSITGVSCTAQLAKGAVANISCEASCAVELAGATAQQTLPFEFSLKLNVKLSLPGETVEIVPPDDLDSYLSAEELEKEIAGRL